MPNVGADFGIMELDAKKMQSEKPFVLAWKHPNCQVRDGSPKSTVKLKTLSQLRTRVQTHKIQTL